MDALYLERLQKGQRKLRLHRDLAARKRDAAAALPVEDLVGQSSLARIRQRPFCAGDRPCACVAGLYAAAARGAAAAVVFAGFRVDGVLRAGTDTRAASDAERRIVKDPVCRLLRFRVLTPFTAQRTALKEHDRADAGAVVDGETLDICENAVYLSFHTRRLLGGDLLLLACDVQENS